MTAAPPRILVVDDEPDIRELLVLSLSRMGLAVTAVGSVGEAMAAVDAGVPFALVLTDMRLPDGAGLALIEHLDRRGRELPIAVITAYGSTDNAVEAMKAGAFDYLQKPVSLAALKALVEQALRRPAPAAPAWTRLVGETAALVEARRLIVRLARTQAPACILGEAGTGKEEAARMIHALGARQAGPFRRLDCAALPEAELEAALFGPAGLLREAGGGTLLLTGIEALPPALQARLLLALERKGLPVDAGTVPLDVRLLCASRQDLAALAARGGFRAELYYRLAVVTLRLPPLRERREDLPLLAAQLLRRHGGPARRWSAAALAALASRSWPGNLSELEAVVEQAAALADGEEIGAAALTAAVAVGPVAEDAEALPDLLDRVERDAIQAALLRTGGNRTAAARLLGVTFRSLRYRMERLGFAHDDEMA